MHRVVEGRYGSLTRMSPLAFERSEARSHLVLTASATLCFAAMCAVIVGSGPVALVWLLLALVAAASLVDARLLSRVRVRSGGGAWNGGPADLSATLDAIRASGWPSRTVGFGIGLVDLLAIAGLAGVFVSAALRA
jgi:hypothetical protein